MKTLLKNSVKYYWLGGVSIKLTDITYILEAEILCCQHTLDRTVSFISAGDLMSNILTSTHPNSLLVTGLVHLQVIRTAEMLDMAGIVFVNGKKPTEDIIELAIQKDIPLFVTDKTLYLTCGLLYLEDMNKQCSGEYIIGL